jgi:hypothetical protein
VPRLHTNDWLWQQINVNTTDRNVFEDGQEAKDKAAGDAKGEESEGKNRSVSLLFVV